MKQISLQGSQITVSVAGDNSPSKKAALSPPPADLLTASPEEINRFGTDTAFRKPAASQSPASSFSSSESENRTVDTTFASEVKEKPLTVNEIIPMLSGIATENKKTFLKNGLSEIRKTALEGTRITLYCKDEYGLDIIRQNIPLLEQELALKTGIGYKLNPELIPDLSKTKQDADSDELSLFRKVFNAELVNTNPFSES